MSPAPTGHLRRTADGRHDLVLERRFRAPIDDVWASVTEPERTARWFGTWRGDAGPGRTIEVRMGFEGEDPPWMPMDIVACEPPRHLAISAVDDHGSWHLELTLEETGGETRLVFVHHLEDPASAENTGPGWEYYLDNLVASRDGTPPPDFNDYYPAQSAHYATPSDG